MAELELPTWELAKEIADALPPKGAKKRQDDEEDQDDLKPFGKKGCK